MELRIIIILLSFVSSQVKTAPHLTIRDILLTILRTMPNTSSAKKALRQNVTRRSLNEAKKVVYKKSVKDVRNAVTKKKLDNITVKLSAAYKALDKAAKTKVIEKNKADRLKSRLTHLVAKSTKASS